MTASESMMPSSLPLPSSESSTGLAVAQVAVKPRKARPFYGRHPWVLDSAVHHVEGEPADGDVVDLVSHQGKFIARGLYNSRSRIRVRLYTWSAKEAIDDALLRRRILRAVELRRQIGYDDPAGAARLVFSEADGLSGLIVDRYADCLVVQLTALALARRIETVRDCLVETLRPRAITVRVDRTVAPLEGMDEPIDADWGAVPDGSVFIEEHGVKYGVELGDGQKTGFYLDQRDNRLAAARLMRGRRVLDMFCYSGAFSLAAAKVGGAREVLGVDSSRRAVAVAQANAALNSLHNVRFEDGDAFASLDGFRTNGERFGAVILDPPKFTRNRRSLDEALRAYHRINRVAVDLLEPGGVLVTCSCSGNVSREDFKYMLVGVAQQTGRTLRILEQRSASLDHPVNANCLESEYLKCFICAVD